MKFFSKVVKNHNKYQLYAYPGDYFEFILILKKTKLVDTARNENSIFVLKSGEKGFYKMKKMLYLVWVVDYKIWDIAQIWLS